MSTVLAILVAIAVGVAIPLGFGVLTPLLADLFEASNTGGPLLFGLLLAGFSGYAAFASVYIGLRMFSKANAAIVFWLLVVLFLVNQLLGGVQRYNEIGDDWLLICVTTISGSIASYIGAGLGRGLAQADAGADG